jgi:hypothetical protein
MQGELKEDAEFSEYMQVLEEEDKFYDSDEFQPKKPEEVKKPKSLADYQ